MKIQKVLLKVMVIISGCGIVLSGITVFLTGGSSERITRTVSVLGGADGPTSIFIAGKVGSSLPLYIITGVLAAATIVLYVTYKKK